MGKPEAVDVIHGGVTREERRKVVERFMQDRDMLVLIANDAAGEGVNLQRGHLMVNYDLPWNPNKIEQRFGRIHRIGQTEVCHLWNLVAAETREGEVYARLLEKLEAARVALGGRVYDVLGDRIRRKRGERALPLHLERIEKTIEPASLECPCCEGALHRIGHDASEALDWVPAIVRVIRTIRPRYGCRTCREGVVQAPAPARAVPGAMVTTSTLAWMATARFAWSIPLNRQLQMLAGQGVILDRSAPSRWMRKLSWWLRPLYQMLLAYIHSQPRIFCDETRMPIQEKGRRRVRNTQFWAHACDDRPWQGPAHPAVVYIHARGRGHDDGGAETWAILASLLQTARLNGLDPFTWLNDVLERIVTGQVKSNDLACLLPWAWTPATIHVHKLAA